ncbi:MAG: proprotein convertase P-domain-containing protein [Myxococcota bacterium]
MRKPTIHTMLASSLFGLWVLLFASVATASVPANTQIEGILSSVGGGPVADGDYAVTFAVYATETAIDPTWAEGPVVLTVKNGAFNHVLGSKVPFDSAKITGNLWIGLKVGNDPELPRRPLAGSFFAVRATLAEGLDCSGCIGPGQVSAALLEPYAKAAALAKVAFSGAYADLTGGPDLSAYVKSASLADIATTGAYADLVGAPAYAKVATTGAYADLANAPVLPKVGASCGTGLVIKGFLADGTYDCVKAMDPAALPADGIDEISNGLLKNQYVDSVAGKAAVPIPDHNPVGISDVLDFPDIGVAQKLGVSVNLTNSKIGTLVVSIIDPNSVEYVLHAKTGTGTVLKTSYPDPTKAVSGDLTTWVGKNPKGKWYLKVIDNDYFNNGTDGAITSWSVDVQTLSSKKISVAGALIVDGTSTLTGKVTAAGGVESTGLVQATGGLTLGTPTTCLAGNKGTLRWAATSGLQACNGANWVAALPRPVIYQGRCGTNAAAGVFYYCLNSEIRNTAADYLTIEATNSATSTVNTVGRITAKIPGYYRFSFNQAGSGYLTYWYMYKNGAALAYGYDNRYTGTAVTHDTGSRIEYLGAGEYFNLRLYGSTVGWNQDSYLEVEYLGQDW